MFLFIMVLCLAIIIVKLREVHREPDLRKPLIKIKPVPKESPGLDDAEKEDETLSEPDRLIREGRYKDAIQILTSMLRDLSSVEDREMAGRVQYRIGACERRIGQHEKEITNLLRSGEALREAVSFFSPERLRSLQMRALSELAGLYEDLAGRGNPIENLNNAIRSWSRGISASRELGLPNQEAVFHSRKGRSYRQLASHENRRNNLQKAIESYEKAVSVPDAFTNPDSAFDKVVFLKTLGDLRAEISAFTNRMDNMDLAVAAFDEALDLMPPEKHPDERGTTLLDMGQVLLDIYDVEQSPAHLRKAVRSLKEAMDLVRGGEDRSKKGFAMALLADALVRYADVKDPEENLDTAVKLYEAALGFLRDHEHALQRKRVKEGLKKAVEKRGRRKEERG